MSFALQGQVGCPIELVPPARIPHSIGVDDWQVGKRGMHLTLRSCHPYLHGVMSCEYTLMILSAHSAHLVWLNWCGIIQRYFLWETHLFVYFCSSCWKIYKNLRTLLFEWRLSPLPLFPPNLYCAPLLLAFGEILWGIFQISQCAPRCYLLPLLFLCKMTPPIFRVCTGSSAAGITAVDRLISDARANGTLSPSSP